MESAAAAAVASAAASEDLHANLESQLRASRADVGRLQNEVKRLQAAATAAASHMTNAMTSPLGRDNNMSFLEQEDSSRLRSRLEASESCCNALQKEVAHLRAEVAAAGVAAISTQAAAVELESPVSRDGSQTASFSGRTAGGRDTLPNGMSQGVDTNLPCSPPLRHLQSAFSLVAVCLSSATQSHFSHDPFVLYWWAPYVGARYQALRVAHLSHNLALPHPPLMGCNLS